MEENRPLWEDRNKFIQNHLETIKKSLSENLSKMPNKDLPFMEQHLRALYFEAYFLMAQGFYNSGLVLCGILLESIVKEKLFMEGVSDEDLEKLDLGKSIQKARDLKVLPDEELSFFDKKRDTLRNPYAHFNKMKLSEGIYFPTWKIPSDQIVPKLIELDTRVKKGELTEAQARQELIKGIKPELMSSKEMRLIAHIAKNQMEKEYAPSIFSEIDKFIREFSEKYFKPKSL